MNYRQTRQASNKNNFTEAGLLPVCPLIEVADELLKIVFYFFTFM